MHLLPFLTLLLCAFVAIVHTHPTTDLESVPTSPDIAAVEVSSIHLVERLQGRSPVPENPILAARNKLWTCSPSGAKEYIGGDCGFSWGGKCFGKCLQVGRQQGCKQGSEASLILKGWCQFPGHKMCGCCCKT